MMLDGKHNPEETDPEKLARLLELAAPSWRAWVVAMVVAVAAVVAVLAFAWIVIFPVLVFAVFVDQAYRRGVVNGCRGPATRRWRRRPGPAARGP